ncbi:Auxin-induced protein 6B [Cardamine amara subsp. amara]|uniref:Auxin-induced protein 6B n=1 Tax=Cardamine amara subsp. amara TaxID=228776 RepID=A0ABD0ZY10_CARAN
MCKKLKHFMRKLQTCCVFTTFSKRVENCGEFEEEGNAATMIPSDVKEGYVAVIAVKGERAKRFVLELKELNKPEFLRLLEQAKDEFGFQPTGPLTIPCQPEEVQKILQGSRKGDS